MTTEKVEAHVVVPIKKPGELSGEAPKLMGAELMFHDNPDGMRRARRALTARGFEVHLFDWRDPYSNTCWLLAWRQVRLDEDQFFRVMTFIVDPFGGEVIEWGHIKTDAELAAWQARDGG
jgi:hypothetical protein